MSPANEPNGLSGVEWIMEMLFPPKETKETKEETNMSYYGGSSLDSILNDLRDKIEEAQGARDELEDAKSNIEDALGDLESYIDEVDSLISNLESIPEIDIRVEVDVNFEAS